ncbi:DUF3717 domain-containing protein [Achromobacter xylosoxidans]|uniref:DUF3717 domain-containing protein n=2 Tax=Alcaligenes xylosoxydans xylosoxydans TaxID=85698 RepID=UPI0009EC01C4
MGTNYKWVQAPLAEAMMRSIGISELEAVINAWREAGESDGVTLSAEVRALADLYGAAIFNRATVIDPTRLSASVRSAMRGPIAAGGLRNMAKHDD